MSRWLLSRWALARQLSPASNAEYLGIFPKLPLAEGRGDGWGRQRLLADVGGDKTGKFTDWTDCAHRSQLSFGVKKGVKTDHFLHEFSPASKLSGNLLTSMLFT